MAKKRKKIPSGKGKAQPQKGETVIKHGGNRYLIYIVAVLLVTAICFSPMLRNSFTNWDDEFYVIQNSLLQGPDWKGIFTQPVVSNYHPLTIISLALNYAMTGLEPSSYLYLNLLLHLINTLLVFSFVLKISRGKTMVALITALLFGIHPMHVESVAWVSERKDLLYSFFFLLSLIRYWQFLESGNRRDLVLCGLFFTLSLLSKPAAIILPGVLLLLDYWHGRKMDRKLIVEKIPFFILSLAFVFITLKLQSRSAIAGLDFYPVWARFFFATYLIMTYFFRFLIPYPLSAFHPYPPPADLGWQVLISPLFLVLLVTILWYNRKKKLIVFSVLFYLVNLLLVLQVISIGNTLLAERYTYMPYVGLAFMLAMLIHEPTFSKYRKTATALVLVASIVFGMITYQRVGVWKNSETLWTDVIGKYPAAPVPRTNRANYLIRIAEYPENRDRKDELMQQALEDCNVALKNKPDHAKGYEDRQNIYLRLNKDSLALQDAETLIRLEPGNHYGYYIKGFVNSKWNKPDSALKYFDRSLEIRPNTDYVLNHRGTILFNSYQQYEKAITDFTRAIQLNPAGNYYLNRSKCYYRLGETDKARADLLIAIQKGQVVDQGYRQLLKI